jgi:predicted P-loop ATPase
MTNLDGVVQMLKKEHGHLSKQMKAITAALLAFGAAYGKKTGIRNGISIAGRARIAAAQRARWAKVKSKSGKDTMVTMPKKRTMSASARRRIAAAQRARWAKVKAAKKSA